MPRWKPGGDLAAVAIVPGEMMMARMGGGNGDADRRSWFHFQGIDDKSC